MSSGTIHVIPSPHEMDLTGKYVSLNDFHFEKVECKLAEGERV